MSNQIAQTILAQLGGSRFIVMTGAKDFLSDDATLRFSLPRGATNKANRVAITLGLDDLYVVRFQQYRNLSVSEISVHDDIDCNQLRALFTAQTGLEVSL
jgi:hypothetical protein